MDTKNRIRHPFMQQWDTGTPMRTRPKSDGTSYCISGLESSFPLATQTHTSLITTMCLSHPFFFLPHLSISRAFALICVCCLYPYLHIAWMSHTHTRQENKNKHKTEQLNHRWTEQHFSQHKIILKSLALSNHFQLTHISINLAQKTKMYLIIESKTVVASTQERNGIWKTKRRVSQVNEILRTWDTQHDRTQKNDIQHWNRCHGFVLLGCGFSVRPSLHFPHSF